MQSPGARAVHNSAEQPQWDAGDGRQYERTHESKSGCRILPRPSRRSGRSRGSRFEPAARSRPGPGRDRHRRCADGGRSVSGLRDRRARFPTTGGTVSRPESHAHRVRRYPADRSRWGSEPTRRSSRSRGSPEEKRSAVGDGPSRGDGSARGRRPRRRTGYDGRNGSAARVAMSHPRYRAGPGRRRLGPCFRTRWRDGTIEASTYLIVT